MKGYFASNPFPEMQMSEEDQQRCSSSSISPMDEDPVLSFPSSQSSFYIVPGVQHGHMSSFMNEYNSYYPQQDYSSGSDSHNSLMYPSSPVDGPPNTFVTTSGGAFTTATPSPTSSISSTSVHNTGSGSGGGTNMYLRVSKDYLNYGDLAFHQGGDSATTSESGPGSSDFDTSGGVHYHDRKIYTRPSSPGSHQHCSMMVSSTTPTHSASMGNNNAQNKPRYPNDNRNSALSTNDNIRKQKYIHNSSNESSNGKKQPYASRGHQNREKAKKRCSNCHSSNSPSWRRSIARHTKGDLLCNACGLYEKTAKKKRMLVTHDDGNTKVVRKRDARDYCCSICGVKDVTRWRRLYDSVQCERCARNGRSSSTRT